MIAGFAAFGQQVLISEVVHDETFGDYRVLLAEHWPGHSMQLTYYFDLANSLDRHVLTAWPCNPEPESRWETATLPVRYDLASIFLQSENTPCPAFLAFVEDPFGVGR